MPLNIMTIAKELFKILGRQQCDEFATVQLPLVEWLVRSEHGERSRRHAQIQQVEQRRIRFGARQPLACDRHGGLMAEHQQFAMLFLGLGKLV